MSFDSRTITYLQTTDTEFRTWVAAIIAQLTAIGLTQTADTGQINTATVTTPAVINTAQGYAIFRYNDTLHATSPIFFKLEFGSGGAITTPSMWLTVGKGTNGAGTIITTVRARIQRSLNANATGVVNTAAYDSSIGCVWAQWSSAYASNSFISMVLHRGCDINTWLPEPNTFSTWFSTSTATAPITQDLVLNASASNGGVPNMFSLSESSGIAGQVPPLINFRPVLYPLHYCYPASALGNGQGWRTFPGVMGIQSAWWYPFQRTRLTFKGTTRVYVTHGHPGFMGGLGANGNIRERFACVVPS